jgi:hypothetical protein
VNGVRRPVLRLGARIRFDDAEHRVVAMDGTTVTSRTPTAARWPCCCPT